MKVPARRSLRGSSFGCRQVFAYDSHFIEASRQFGFVSPEDLILSKLEWAEESRSEVQLNDVRNLLRDVKGLNRSYLTRWARALGVETLYREVKQ